MLLQVKHNFETAHRLPFLEGKCQNIHGHSWHVTFAFEVDTNDDGIALDLAGRVLDFGRVKRVIREYIDTFMDHGAMLGIEDSLLQAFIDDGCKVQIYGDPDYPTLTHLKWPTVENVARHLFEMCQQQLADAPIKYVDLWETDVNGVVYA